MTARRTLQVTLAAPSPDVALRAAQALAVETRDAPPGTTVNVRAEGDRLLLSFEAEETRALRAAANSFLRWADVALAVAGSVKPR
jgi:tRNA threonylcarbamoyladenosine modification (KEOPS) complex  Pcc1 subunit